LFSSQILFVVDKVNAPVLIAGTTAVLSIVLSTAVKLADKEYRFRGMVLAYGGVAIAAMISANLLTVAISWALIDFVTLLRGLRESADIGGTSNLAERLMLNVAGLFMIIAAAIAAGASGGTEALAESSSSWAMALLIIAALLRIDLIGTGANDEVELDDDAFGAIAGVLPQAAAFIMVGRQLSFGIHEELIVWLRVMCLLGLMLAGIRGMVEEGIRQRQRFFNIGMIFIGLVVSSAVPAGADVPITSAIGAMILVGTISRIVRIHSPWQRAIPILATLILVMPAWTVGANLVQGIASLLESGANVGFVVLGSLGLGLMIVGILRDVFKTSMIWYVDDLARLLYTLALLMPVAIGFWLGIGTGAGVGLRPALVSLIAAGAAAGVFGAMRRMDSRLLPQIRDGFSRFRPAPLLNIARGGLRWSSKSLRTIGGVLEGEGAMLWIFVILMLIQLAIVAIQS
jgi:hypothetical protein